ncbi:uncharacterized protein BDV17DRAFT_295229 [Aspergillus undulatus]|uniref:uncharacterized protein n=1 Tax=Aspergillus undulatus TaxID=1810928 RepID=UPI003CCDCD49
MSGADKQLAVSTLYQITRSLPHLYSCHDCGTLHRTEHVSHPGAHTRKYDHICPDIAPLHKYRKHDPLFYFFDIHSTMYCRFVFRRHHLVAMKNYYTGHRRGLTVNSLEWRESVNWPQDSPITTLLSVHARVDTVADRPVLILQVQNWLLFHDKDPSTDEILCGLKPIRICGHIKLNRDRWTLIMGTAPENWIFTGDSANHSNTFCCSVCGVVFRGSLLDCNRDGKAVIITKWMSLGSGLEMDDPQWVRITSSRHTRRTPTPVEEPLDQVPLTKAFDDAWDSTERNEWCLTQKRYRETLESRIHGIYWVYSDRAVVDCDYYPD